MATVIQCSINNSSLHLHPAKNCFELHGRKKNQPRGCRERSCDRVDDFSQALPGEEAEADEAADAAAEEEEQGEGEAEEPPADGEDEAEAEAEEEEAEDGGEEELQPDEEADELVEHGNMEQLATLVLTGEGHRLVGRHSSNPELQAFIDNVPAYMVYCIRR